MIAHLASAASEALPSALIEAMRLHPDIKVLSIRQPFAWAILHAGKTIENRTWWTRYRGPVLIHASKVCTCSEYEDACEFIAGVTPIAIPPLAEIERGGIVGMARIVDCVRRDPSPWFEGPYGFVLEQTTRLPFFTCRARSAFSPLLPAKARTD
jgi:hypothetical protein